MFWYFCVYSTDAGDRIIFLYRAFEFSGWTFIVLNWISEFYQAFPVFPSTDDLHQVLSTT